MAFPLQLTILGSGTCVPSRTTVSSGYALEIDRQLIVFDFGTGCLHRLAQANLDYRAIDHIFFSHLHLDHINDLGALLFALKNSLNFNFARELTLWGPSGFASYFDDLCQLHHFDLINWPRVEELNDDVRRFKHWNLKSKPMCHGKRPSLGYRVETEAGVFAYSGDTDYCEALVQLIRQADLALMECSFPDALRMPSHLSPELVFRAARQAECKNVVLTHRYPVEGAEQILTTGWSDLAGHCYLARDLMQVQISGEKLTILTP